jgi:CelD/BcsL family acetyltransferase involved in cellulose biosynthesis
MSVSWEVLDSVEAVEPLVADWDRLAVDAGLPYCAPAFLLAWWKHASPEGAHLRLIAVRGDSGALVGVGPFCAVRRHPGLWTWSLLGTDTSSRIEPLAGTGQQAQVGEALARALAAGTPRPALIRLEGLPQESPWPEALRTGWPTRRKPYRHTEPPTPAPVVPLDGLTDVDAFLGTRSSNFRQQMRRARRKLDKDGGSFRVASTAEEIERDLHDFERLHTARWEWRGGSTALTSGTGDMLAEAGRELLDSGRFQLLSLEIDGKVVASQLFLGAGTEMSYWNGGFDDDYASYKPSLIALVEAIRTSLEAGITRFDLGPGAQEYKYRFSDTQDLLVWQTLIPPGPRYLAARAAFAPKQARHAFSKRLTREQKDKIKRLLRRR